MKKKKKLLFVNFVIALIAILAVGGIYLFSNKEQKSTKNEVATANETATKVNVNQNQDTKKNKDENKTITKKEENKDEDSTKSKEMAGGKEDTSTVTLSMVGDMLLHARVSTSGLQKNGKYNYDYLFSKVKKDVKKSDIALVNEEVLLCGPKYRISGYPTFNGRFEVADAIEKSGFDVVLHATNHSMDRGANGVKTCLNNWRKKHPKLKITGMYDNKKDSRKITYVKKNGIKIATLNYTYGTNGLPLPSNMPYAVNLMSKAKIKADVRKAKKHADFVVVCPHWGIEYQTKPSDNQKMWCNFFMKIGVNLVIGTHPHVIQPVEMYKDNKGHKMLVYYSLGNFINATSRRGTGVYRQFCGGMADVTIKKEGNKKATIDSAKFIPLITHWNYHNGKITTYELKDYGAKTAARNHVKDLDRTYSLNRLHSFFKEVVSNKYLAK